MADLMVAVITGGHWYDVPAFTRMWRALEGIEAFIQPLEDWAVDNGRVRTRYDVTAFYNMHQPTPAPDAKGTEGRIRQAIEALGTTEQGLVVLHHALLAFPQWRLWSDLVGMPDRAFKTYAHGVRMPLRVVDPEHPITRGLTSFEIVDETYDMPDCAPDNHLLVDCEAPGSLKTIAWCRAHGRSRVFCYQGGHDRTAFEHPGFRQLVERGVKWAAGAV